MTETNDSHIYIRLDIKALFNSLLFILSGGIVGWGGLQLASPPSDFVIDTGRQVVQQLASLDSTVAKYARQSAKQDVAILYNKRAIDSLKTQTARGFGALEYQGNLILEKVEALENKVKNQK